MADTFGTGDYQYELVEGWGQWPIDGIASDVATTSNGNVYVAVRTSYSGLYTRAGDNSNTGVIVVFDKNGNFLSQWGEEYFATPHGLWISPNDEIFHADSGNHTVTRFNSNGELLMSIGVKDELGPQGEPFRSPTRAVQSASGEIFVSDGYWQNRVHKFTNNGDLISSWGEGEPVFNQEAWELYRKEDNPNATGNTGTGPGEFNLPHDVTVDSNDNVYIMDRENNRCQIFDIDGDFINEWKDVRGPNDAVIDDNEVMHIAEGIGSVLITTLKGEVIGRWGSKGEDPGNFRGSPHGIWIDKQGDMYISEVGTTKGLQKFARV